uniref:Uncharacterized protein n=1 Tax=Oryza glumipatula TaxID=40148 RepID=A0A0D9ZIS7_9ORYZ
MHSVPSEWDFLVYFKGASVRRCIMFELTLVMADEHKLEAVSINVKTNGATSEKRLCSFNI